MIEIIWDDGFKRSVKKWSRKNPELVEIFERQLNRFVQEPFHHTLKTHILSGKLKDCWAFRITYDHRVVFHFIDDQTKAILVDIGKHDEVY